MLPLGVWSDGRAGCFADTWYPNGTVSSPNTAVEGSPNAGSYQPVRILPATIPTLTLTGVQQGRQQLEASACQDPGSACLKSAWQIVPVYIQNLSSFSSLLELFHICT